MSDLKKTSSKRAGEMFALRLKLAAYGATVVSDDGGRVGVRFPEQHREAIIEIMNEHGIVTS